MSRPLRVLLVEDSPTDAKLIERALRSGGLVVELDRVDTPQEMRLALAKGGWDVIISDWSMPRFSGRGALDVMKEAGLDLPFIIVSGTVGEEVAVDAMRAGAHDYVLKDKLARLAPAIEREIRERGVRADRARALDDLLTAQSRFARLFESGVIGLVIGDLHGRVFEANDTYLGMVGYSRRELEAGDVHWSELTPPEHREVTERGIAELAARGAATPYEKEYLRRDGSRVAVLAGFATIAEARTIGFMVDLTAQKNAERALDKSEEQLRHAQKMEAVGRLAGGVAHDFNNMLSVILSYSALIAGELAPDDPIRADAEAITDAGRRAADLTKQLLLFSRQEVAEVRILDPNELLAGMDKMLRRLLGEDVEFTCTRAAEIGRIRADRSHVEQIVMNLVVNARDAMPKGGKLTIETSNVVLDEAYAREHHGAVPGHHVMLAVSDTGAGISPDIQARIFEPFFTTKERGRGTGLGLSTVFGIVQQSGGTIWVYSELHHGTTFKVYLPSLDQEADVVRPTLVPKTLNGTETILLVEDDDRVRAVASGILKRYQYRVIEARNGGEALHLCESFAGEIHLLLSDVVMPEMSGPELAKRVERTRPRMKVLCMSGYTSDAIVRHGTLEPGTAFLQKPFTPTTLTRKVREVIDGL